MIWLFFIFKQIKLKMVKHMEEMNEIEKYFAGLEGVNGV